VTALAAVLSTADPERLYSGLSVLVSRATEGAGCAALASFGSLELLLDRDLAQRTRIEALGPSLAQLRDTALDLDGLTVHACSAAVETLGLDRAELELRLDGVMSTPRFLREHDAAQLIFV
jgi:hypothetical protein